jgi:hypothetical protein
MKTQLHYGYNPNIKKDDRVAIAIEIRERRELMEQIQSPLFTGDNVDQVL